jgi:hypothetical protein
MPDLRSRIGRYCIICQSTHKEEYLVCDYCNEHKTWIYLRDRYYNYGFSKRSYHTYGDCYSGLFSPRLVEEHTMWKAYQSIMQVIKDRTDNNTGDESKAIDYYEAVRIAYIESEYMQKYLGTTIKDIKEINKTFKPIWEFTYKISGGEEKRVKLARRDPDNLLVSWIPGENVYCE